MADSPWHLPRHILWSTECLELADPFQRWRHLRQVLSHGRAADFGRLDLADGERELDAVQLPPGSQTPPGMPG